MKKRIVIIMVLAALLIFSGCSEMLLAMMEAIEEDDVKADVEDILNAVENEDSEFIYNTYFSSKDEFLEDDIYSGMQDIYNIYKGKRVDEQFYNVKVNSFTNAGGTRTVKTVVYLVKTDIDPYLLTINYIKGEDGKYDLYGINISLFLDYVVNSSFKDYDLKSWGVFTLNIISYGIMLVALILCLKTKMKLKPLWIILILLQIGITKTAFPNYFSTNFSVIQLLGISRYQIYAHGGTITSVSFHVFAVIFLFVRKNLNKAYLYQEEMKRKQQEHLAQKQLENQNAETPIIEESSKTINE